MLGEYKQRWNRIVSTTLLFVLVVSVVTAPALAQTLRVEYQADDDPQPEFDVFIDNEGGEVLVETRLYADLTDSEYASGWAGERLVASIYAKTDGSWERLHHHSFAILGGPDDQAELEVKTSSVPDGTTEFRIELEFYGYWDGRYGGSPAWRLMWEETDYRTVNEG